MPKCARCQSETVASGACHRCLLQMAMEVKQKRRFQQDSMDSPGVESTDIQDLQKHFPNLEIKRLIGRGGMGAIYHARQTSLQRDVAIKVIDRRISNNPEFVDRFEREAIALAKFSHPNIVAVYDHGKTSDGLVFLVMEYVHGLNLREAMEQMPIDLHDSVDMMLALGNALQYAHSKGVVHRDIKPENILLNEDGGVKIADFGIAKILDANVAKRITATQQVLGTLHYLAPEQLDSPDEVDHRVDIYALGVVFYELLTKQLPVGNFELPSVINTTVASSYDAIIMKALHRRPTSRFQSAEELRAAIERASSAAIGRESVAYESKIDPMPTIEPIASNGVVSVPFEKEDMAGFARVRGTVQAKSNGIQLEYRISDAIFGQFKSKMHIIELPWSRIVSLGFRHGIFSGMIAIVGDSLSALKDFPHSETGKIEVRVKASDFELARRFVHKVRLHQPQLLANDPKLSKSHSSPNFVLGSMLLFIAIMNAGVLAIAQIVMASHLTDWLHVVGAVAVGVILGPITAIQIVAGILHLATGNRQILWVGVLSAMQPLSPVAIFGIPLGIATKWWMENDRADAAQNNLIASANKGWGATTLMFVRDSRNARFISLLETVGCLLVFGGLALYWFGIYPTSIEYRIVGSIPLETVQPAVKSRVLEVGSSNISSNTDGRIAIACFQFQVARIEQQLGISSPLTLVAIPLVTTQTSDNNQNANAKEDDSTTTNGHESQSASDAVYRPCLPLSQAGKLVGRKTPTGFEAKAASRLELNQSHISRVSVEKGTISIDFSSSIANEMKNQSSSASNEFALGLEINGWIEAIALPEDTRGRTIRFQPSSESKHSVESIQAALRGPGIPAELERVR
jgi:serine/threonine protein kinase